MNFLWLMYLADVFGSVSAVLSAWVAVGSIGVMIWLIVWGVSHDSMRADAPIPLPRKWLIGSIIAAAIVASAIPSQKTIYAAAAVSAGSDVAATETGQKALKALNVWLDKQSKAD